VKGSASVLIGGLPAARLGDPTAHGGRIVLGCFTVLIGDESATGLGGQGAAEEPFCIKEAANKAAAFVRGG
jgi:hypothetical protein